MTEDSEYELYLDTMQEIIDLQNAGDISGAVDLISSNLSKYSNKAELLLLTAVCSYRRNAAGQAIELCEQAHKIDPDCQEVVDSLAVLKTITGNINDGLYYAKLATTLNPHPDLPELLPSDFSNFFHALSAAAPSRHYLEGLYLFNGRRFADSITEFQSELSLNANNLDAVKKMGHAQLFTGEVDEALANLKRYSDEHPGNAETVALLAMGKCMLGDFAGAAELCQAAIDLEPESLETVMQALEAARYFDGEQAALYGEFVTRANKLAAEAAAEFSVDAKPRNKEAGEPIKLAFLSNDLRAGDQHAFLLPVFENINTKVFNLTVYQQSPTGGPAFQELKSKAPSLRRVVDMDDDVLSLILSRQKTDVLVDLCGLSSNSRAAVFAARPAPVIINLLCEPFGFRAPGSNIIISDSATVAMDEKNLGDGQQIVQTEGGLFALNAPKLMSEVKPLPALENQFITFGAHCKAQHFSEATIAFWGAVLNAVDGSRLLLGNVVNIPRQTRERIYEMFVDTGVSDRIDFLEASVADGPDSKFFNSIDIFLDSTPVNGTTVLCHALWMGVPVITAKAGRRSSTLGASILTSAGEPAWIGEDIDDATQKALTLTADIDALAEKRAQLRNATKASMLMDTKGYTAKMQAAFKAAFDLVSAKS